ncbi:MAG: hypothetical protein H0U27_01860 [Nitrosopumilus sp.]|nr:hypothetical protein [Nitrosopumilus sp.]
MQLPTNFYTESLDKTYLKTELESLKFKYGYVEYDNFSKNYDNSLLAYRFEDQKINDSFVSCIFSAAIAGLVKTTYHAALTIFSAIPQALYYRNADYLLLQAQYIARDFQEASGYLIAGLYDSKWGLFVIQESSTQKTCYDNYASKEQSKVEKFPEPKSPFLPSHIEGLAKIQSDHAARQKELSDQMNKLMDNSFEKPLITTPKQAMKLAPKFPPLEPLPQDPNEAIKLIENQHERGKSGEHLYCLACQYYEEKKFDEAYTVLKNYNIKIEHKTELAKLMAEDLYANEKYDLAYKMIQLHGVDDKVKGDFYVKLANRYFLDDKQEEAYNMINKFGVDSKVKADFHVKLAKHYFEKKKDLENAHKMINSYGIDSQIKADFYVVLADEYFKQKNYTKTVELIRTHGLIKDEIKGPYLKKLADIYLLDGKLIAACELIKDPSITKDVRLQFVTSMLEKYENEKDWKNLKIIAEACDKEQKHHYFAIIIEQCLMEETIEGKEIAADLIVKIFQTAFLLSGPIKNLKNIDFSSTLDLVREFPMKNIDSIGVKFLDGIPSDGIDYIYKLVNEPSTIEYIVKYEV